MPNPDVLYLGIDGCRKGWVCVGFRAAAAGAIAPARSGTSREIWIVDLVDKLATISARFPNARRILVDIPIGLRNAGTAPRECDQAARRFLGPGRASSVFSAPVRPVLKASGYLDACRVSKALTGKKLSKQAWGICPKIDEADRLMRTDHWARSRIRESHPEVCFRALAGDDAGFQNKRTELGFRQRLDVLSHFEPHAMDVVERAMNGHRRKDLARDDVVDALCLAITSRAEAMEIGTLPDEPPEDPCGLPMEMVFCLPRVPLNGK